MTIAQQDANSMPLTMTIPEVAEALQCSERHLFDMRKDLRMPLPTKTGKTKGVRWSRRVIEEWIDAGCPTLAV